MSIPDAFHTCAWRTTPRGEHRNAHPGHPAFLLRAYLDQVLPDDLDLLQIAAHLVVHQREPVGDPEDERAAGSRALVHVHRFEDPLRDVHAPGRLKAVVQDKAGLLDEQIAKVRLRHTLLAHRTLHQASQPSSPFDHAFMSLPFCPILGDSISWCAYVCVRARGRWWRLATSRAKRASRSSSALAAGIDAAVVSCADFGLPSEDDDGLACQ
jgi:hypothetical protein